MDEAETQKPTDLAANLLTEISRDLSKAFPSNRLASVVPADALTNDRARYAGIVADDDLV